MAAPINKIVLKNTTKLTLNERFSAYRTQAQNFANTLRQKILMQRQATSANLRLAQQMGNRPSVITALRLKKRSLQQRLGRQQPSISNVKSRLNLSGKRFNNGSVQSRLGTQKGRGSINRRGGFKPGTSPLIKARLGQPNPGFNYVTPNQQGFRRKRGNFKGANRPVRGVGNRVQTSNGRGNRNSSRGRGRGGRWNRKPESVPTRQELDNQLDEYMAETKSSLDVQLEQYMSQG